MPEMVRWLFWFHIRASVVMWPSAASRICSLVHSMCSFSIVTSNQLSSYQPKRVQYPQYSKNVLYQTTYVYVNLFTCFRTLAINFGILFIGSRNTKHPIVMGLQGMVFHMSVFMFFYIENAQFTAAERYIIDQIQHKCVITSP